jgi:hypothetical protein
MMILLLLLCMFFPVMTVTHVFRVMQYQTASESPWATLFRITSWKWAGALEATVLVLFLFGLHLFRPFHNA